MTKESVAQLLNDAAEQSPDRLAGLTDVLEAAFDQGDDVSYYACIALNEICREHRNVIVVELRPRCPLPKYSERRGSEGQV